MKIIQRALLLLIRSYKLLISPLLGERCRFFPSCSDYASETVSVHGTNLHGLLRGLALIVQRVLRCHPFHRGGYDPVPNSKPSQKGLA